MAPTQIILRVEALTAGYGRAIVLRELSLHLAAGEILAVVGPNGSGKSSLLRAVLGSLAPGAGAVTWFDRALPTWPRRQLARRVAYLPQAPRSLPGQRVGEVVASGRSPYWGAFGVESASDRRAVAEAAELLGVSGWLDRDVSTLSGGQRQRVFIARCVAQTLEAGGGAILLDEPDTFLDLRHIADLAAMLRALARGRGLGILLASHDLNLAAGLADRMLLLSDGAAATSGTPNDVMRPEIVERVYGVKVTALEAGGRRVLVPA